MPDVQPDVQAWSPSSRSSPEPLPAAAQIPISASGRAGVAQHAGCLPLAAIPRPQDLRPAAAAQLNLTRLQQDGPEVLRHPPPSCPARRAKDQPPKPVSGLAPAQVSGQLSGRLSGRLSGLLPGPARPFPVPDALNWPQAGPAPFAQGRDRIPERKVPAACERSSVPCRPTPAPVPFQPRRAIREPIASVPVELTGPSRLHPDVSAQRGVPVRALLLRTEGAPKRCLPTPDWPVSPQVPAGCHPPPVAALQAPPAPSGLNQWATQRLRPRLAPSPIPVREVAPNPAEATPAGSADWHCRLPARRRLPLRQHRLWQQREAELNRKPLAAVDRTRPDRSASPARPVQQKVGRLEA